MSEKEKQPRKLNAVFGLFALVVAFSALALIVNQPEVAATFTSITNSDGTLTISPATGNVVASIALAHANTWTGTQTFQGSPNIFYNGAIETSNQRWILQYTGHDFNTGIGALQITPAGGNNAAELDLAPAGSGNAAGFAIFNAADQTNAGLSYFQQASTTARLAMRSTGSGSVTSFEIDIGNSNAESMKWTTTPTVELAVNMVPPSDNSVDVGTPALRFALVRAVTITSGDLNFWPNPCGVSIHGVVTNPPGCTNGPLYTLTEDPNGGGLILENHVTGQNSTVTTSPIVKSP